MIPKHDSFDLIVPFILNGRFQKGQFISANFTLSIEARQAIHWENNFICSFQPIHSWGLEKKEKRRLIQPVITHFHRKWP